MKFNDRVSIGATKKTKEGYLVATARVARTGVQEYYARELGDVAVEAGFEPDDVVRVYRHADQVFSDATLLSITRVPVTVNHPPESVTADNWAKYSVGEVGDSYTRADDWIVVNPMIKDSNAIKVAQTTHKQISMGYDAKIVPARDGIDADFEMVDIQMNHLAFVPRGRAGDKARIGDSWGASPITDFQPSKLGGQNMSDALKTVVLGDAAVQVALTDVAAVEAFKASALKAIADAESSHVSAISAKDEEIGKLRADLATAQAAAVVDIDSLVAARTELVSKVHAIDAKIVPTGLSDADLRKAAVVSKFGDAITAGASDAEIAGMFKAIVVDAKPANPAAQVFMGGIKSISDADINDAQNAYVARLTRQTKEK